MVDKISLLDVIELERTLHPGMDERDLQKLIYQSVFGGDHLLEDPQRYAEAVRAEWDHLPVGRTDPGVGALQPIDPEGKTARIHLNPCKEAGIDIERLIELLASQGRKNGRRPDYIERWNAVIGLAVDGAIPFSAEDIEQAGFPESTPHHGPAYGFASYRIVNDVTESMMAERLRRLGVR